MDLQNKTVLISGSTRGIGLAMAEAFYKASCRIVLNGRQSVSEQVLAKFPDSKRVFAVAGDVADAQQAQDMVAQTIDHFGGLDILINNAGITRDMLANRMTLADFKAPIETNLIGSFNLTQPALKAMYRARSGCIINISSVVALIGNVGQINYAASKAGLIGMTKTIAREAARRQVRCNAIAPGMIATDMVAVLSDKTQEKLKSEIPLGHFGTPEAVSAAAIFLAENDYVTGQVITVDGGLAMV